jgi:adenylate kinase
MRIVVTGVPGVGKSTCMKAASERLGWEIVNFGTFMFEAAKAEGVIESRDDMRKMALEDQRRIQKLAAEKIAEMENVIIDTHLTIKTPKGYLPGIPAWVAEKLQPITIFIVEASPEEIYNRRKKDPSRNRDPDTVSDIEMHQQINRIAGTTDAVILGATIKVIINADGKVDETVKSMLETL